MTQTPEVTKTTIGDLEVELAPYDETKFMVNIESGELAANFLLTDDQARALAHTLLDWVDDE